jgi:hypothetical protein
VPSSDFDYSGTKASLATLHDKESVIAPIFQSELGVDVQLAAVDTDQFGTFSGERPRMLSQLDTAIAKARAAIELTGIPLAIASEGTIGAHPMIPSAASDLETIVFLDSERDLVIHQWYRSSEIVTARKIIQPGQNLEEFLARADFPNHGLIVRSQHQLSRPAIKGIRDLGKLQQAIGEIGERSGSVIVESDLRANYSPSRMKNIAECARLLVKRIASPCPECNAPGWGSIEPIFGLPCGDCGDLVESAVMADQDGCVSCDHKVAVPREADTAEARFCTLCNP